MSEFEDRELAERLGRASGAFPDENAAYATVWRGVRRAKRRRALAAGTMAVAAARRRRCSSVSPCAVAMGRAG